MKNHKLIIVQIIVLITVHNASAQYIGIGTNSPTEKLHVVGATDADVVIKNESAGTNGSASFQAKGTGGLYDYFQMTKYNATVAGNVAGVNLANLSLLYSGANAGAMLLDVITANPMQLATGNTVRMTINAIGNVGIGTVTPTSSNKLQVVNASGSSNQHGVHGIAGTVPSGSITPASGIYGESNAGIGVSGVGQSNDGVFGYSLSGTAAGVEGYNATIGGAGVLGVADPAGSFGGYFDGGFAGYGVVVENGLSGFGTISPGAMLHVSGSKDLTVTLGGIPFTHQAFLSETSSAATSNLSSAVIGYGANSTFENHGVHAFARGSGGSAYNVGLYAAAASATTSTGNSYGAYGSASGGANNYGIYGSETGTGYAGYFSGSVHITGTLSKGAGTFLIDHPLDPENKYLYHSFVESPDMMNIYNGNVKTDANGDATVNMPSYFEALNKDFRYQLTVIGSFAQAIIKDEISGNSFTIKTDKPGIKVSWMVTGVRQDKFANAHRVIPEVEKEPEFKGLYLHAAEWGQPENKSIDFATRPRGANELSGAGENTVQPVNKDQPHPLSGRDKVVNKIHS